MRAGTQVLIDKDTAVCYHDGVINRCLTEEILMSGFTNVILEEQNGKALCF